MPSPPPQPFYRFKTYLGTPQSEFGTAVAVGLNDNIYVVGVTRGTAKFEGAPNPQVQTQPGGDADAFAMQVNEGGGGSQWFTFLGGTGSEIAHGVKVTDMHQAVVGGRTSSTNFPTSGSALQPNYGGGNSDTFIVKINALGNQKEFGTYLGGSMDDETNLSGNPVSLTEDDDILFVGSTTSANFKIVDPMPPKGAQLAGQRDCFVALLKADGKSLVSTSFFGGTQDDDCRATAYQGGLGYLVGQTESTGAVTGIPVTPDAQQLNAPAPSNGFVAVVVFDNTPPPPPPSNKEYHPADTSKNFQISLGEAAAYVDAYKKDLSWPVPPSPPSLGYAARAVDIFKKGKDEMYTDEGGPAPGRWVAVPQ